MWNHNEKILIRIIIKWLGFYALLYLLYIFSISGDFPDFFTRQTTIQVNALLHTLGFDSHWQITMPRETGIFIGKYWVARIVEGCNGMSIIILFLAFVWAFPASWKKKAAFSLWGIVILWLINLFRISLLAWIYYRYPDYFDIMHRVFFPGIMYGTVIVLWVVWASRVSMSLTKDFFQ